MNVKTILLALAAVVIVGLGWYFFKSKPIAKKETLALTAKVKKGQFKVKVSATGELQAKRSEKIQGPQGMRTNGIWQTNITDMVAEGTIVKAGDYVATLDKTELGNRMRDSQTELDKILTQLEQAKIDTAIELRALRDELVNLQFLKKEKNLQLEQSRYEPQSVIQQAKLDLERTERDYQQLLKKYELSQEKSNARISEINANLRQNQDKLNQLAQLSEEFVVKAPKPGMVIYARSWNGKVGPGSQVHAWDPIVAELPDLSDMVSKTYVNEVDISKVRKGQDVKIKIDAFPDKEYTGRVIQVANIGEQLKDYDAKVFEVVIQVHESDSVMRPAMTTSNEIVTYTYPDVLFIPLEALQSDSLSFVYKKTEDGKIVKQEVITGESNEDEIIIEHGLAENEEIFFAPPKDAEKLPFVPLPAKIKEDIRKKQEAERKKREEEALARSRKIKDENIQSDNGGGGSFIIIE